MHGVTQKLSSRFAQHRGSPNFLGLDAAAQEVWRHKKIRLYRGDCMQLLPVLGQNSIDALIADPPYGSTDCAWDEAVDWQAVLPLLRSVTLPHSPMALFASGKFAFELAHQLGNLFRYELVWEKDRSVGFLDANHRPLRAHEFILIAARRFLGSTYNPQRVAAAGPVRLGHTVRAPRKGTVYHGHDRTTIYCDDGLRHPRSVLRFPVPTSVDRIHPTQKPLALLEWLVRSYTRPGGLVLDPWSGSGTTALACLNAGRRFVGFERDPEIFAAAVKRLEAAVGAG